jgi:hypothetical protein
VLYLCFDQKIARTSYSSSSSSSRGFRSNSIAEVVTASLQYIVYHLSSAPNRIYHRLSAIHCAEIYSTMPDSCVLEDIIWTFSRKDIDRTAIDSPRLFESPTRLTCRVFRASNGVALTVKWRILRDLLLLNGLRWSSDLTQECFSRKIIHSHYFRKPALYLEKGVPWYPSWYHPAMRVSNWRCIGFLLAAHNTLELSLLRAYSEQRARNTQCVAIFSASA